MTGRGSGMCRVPFAIYCLDNRRTPQQLIDRTDLVAEMQEVKHYYQQGVMARQGIEW